MIWAFFENTQADRNNASKLRFAAVVCVVLKLDGTGLVYGQEGGMRLEEIADNPQDPNLGNIIVVTCKTKASQPGETQLPVVVNTGTVAGTRTLIRGLNTPGV